MLRGVSTPAGNLLSDGTHSYTYDAEGRISKVDGGSTATYTYDANGQRVRKATSSGTTDYIYDLAGHEIAEVNGSGGWMRGEVYAGGHHLATYVNSTTYFIHADWLGTERVRSTLAAASCETTVSLPFGDGQSSTGACTDVSPLHFTGKIRDTESNLDDFGARYNSSQFGRFMSPDLLAGRVVNPQTLNRYAYVLNNPLLFVDPNGLQAQMFGAYHIATYVEPTYGSVLDRFLSDALLALGGTSASKGESVREETNPWGTAGMSVVTKGPTYQGTAFGPQDHHWKFTGTLQTAYFATFRESQLTTSFRDSEGKHQRSTTMIEVTLWSTPETPTGRAMGVYAAEFSASGEQTGVRPSWNPTFKNVPDKYLSALVNKLWSTENMQMLAYEAQIEEDRRREAEKRKNKK
jgi:RHS repeat-associated protein